MAPERVAFERREDLLERTLADLADAARRQLVALAVLADEACLFEQLDHLLHLLEGLTCAMAGEALDLIWIERIEIIGGSRAANDLLHVRELVHLVHQPECLGERHR